MCIIKNVSNTHVFAAIIESTVFRHIRSTISSTAIQNSINHFRDASSRYGGDLEAVAMHRKRVFIKNASSTCVFAAIIESMIFRHIRSTISSTRIEIVSRVSDLFHIGMVGTWKQ